MRESTASATAAAAAALGSAPPPAAFAAGAFGSHELPDAWLNLAHVLVEQGQLVSAIKLYAKCSKQFHRDRDVGVLLYLARAYYKNKQMMECKHALAKALHLAPQMELVRGFLTKYSYTFGFWFLLPFPCLIII